MRTLIIGFSWISPLIAIAVWPFAPVEGVLLMAFSHTLLLVAVLRPNVQWLGPVITHFDPEGREVWLTIDDGPTDDTPEILKLLAERGIRATFFVKGTLAGARHDLVEAIESAGHEIGNHSHTHPSAWFWCLPPSDIATEIDRCTAVIGQRARFRAPVGMKNPAVHPALRDRGMRLIGWSIRGLDTVTADAERVASRIVPHVVPGAIIVLHQGRPQSAACITRVIDALRSDGYTFVVPGDDRLKTNR